MSWCWWTPTKFSRPIEASSEIMLRQLMLECKSKRELRRPVCMYEIMVLLLFLHQYFF